MHWTHVVEVCFHGASEGEFDFLGHIGPVNWPRDDLLTIFTLSDSHYRNCINKFNKWQLYSSIEMSCTQIGQSLDGGSVERYGTTSCMRSLVSRAYVWVYSRLPTTSITSVCLKSFLDNQIMHIAEYINISVWKSRSREQMPGC